MRKLGIVVLVMAVVVGVGSLVSAADVKVSGKVDVRQNLGGLDTTETGYNMKGIDVREARLTAKAAVTDKVGAQISYNFEAGGPATLEANNSGLGDTYANIALGGGSLLVGQTSLPGFVIRETILSKECLSNVSPHRSLTADNIIQVRYSGKVDVVSYAIAVIDGSSGKKGAAGTKDTTKDAIVNINADVSGAMLGATYSFDSDDDNGGKQSFYAANLGYKLNPVDLTVQYIGGLDKTVVGNNDISDKTKAAPKSEIVLDVGYKMSDKQSVSVGYDMYGKSNAITLKGSCKAVDGVTFVLRADMLGSDYKKVSPAANNISLGVVAEF